VNCLFREPWPRFRRSSKFLLEHNGRLKLLKLLELLELVRDGPAHRPPGRCLAAHAPRDDDERGITPIPIPQSLRSNSNRTPSDCAARIGPARPVGIDARSRPPRSAPSPLTPFSSSLGAQIEQLRQGPRQRLHRASLLARYPFGLKSYPQGGNLRKVQERGNRQAHNQPSGQEERLHAAHNPRAVSVPRGCSGRPERRCHHPYRCGRPRIL